MKALIIDDHPLVLQGCRDLLGAACGYELLGAPTLREGLRLYRRHEPDVVVLDLSIQSDALSGLNFLNWLRLHDRTTAVIVFTMHSDAGMAKRAIEAGANAFVTKDGNINDLLVALRQIEQGKSFISADVATKLAFNRDLPDAFADLTLRELDTLKLLGAGRRYEGIAGELNVSYKTIVNTVSALKRKLGARSLGELTRVAITGNAGGGQGQAS
jgi:DNA-binding NarL/FixJ family response regulator